MKLGYLAALAAAVLANSADAVTINTGVTAAGATHVRLTHSLPGGGNSFIQIGELQAFTPGGVNVAAASNGGIATGTPAYATSAASANDGSTNRSYSTPPGIFHSSNGSDDFLRIDFAAPVTLASLVIYGRDDYISRDSWQVALFAGSTSLWSGVVDASDGSIATVNFGNPQSTGAIPEPASWALLITGFGLVGAAIRRVRPSATVPASRA